MIDLKETLAGSELSYEELTNVAAKSAKENERLKMGNEGLIKRNEEITKENEMLIRENAVLKDLVVKLATHIEL